MDHHARKTKFQISNPDYFLVNEIPNQMSKRKPVMALLSDRKITYVSAVIMDERIIWDCEVKRELEEIMRDQI